LGAHPKGIGSGRLARNEAVCIGTISTGGFNNCSKKAKRALVTAGENQRGEPILVVLGACDRHVLGAQLYLLEKVSIDGDVTVTTPEALARTLTDEEKSWVHQVVPKVQTA
jgi:hypothetical protein